MIWIFRKSDSMQLSDVQWRQKRIQSMFYGVCITIQLVSIPNRWFVQLSGMERFRWVLAERSSSWNFGKLDGVRKQHYVGFWSFFLHHKDNVKQSFEPSRIPKWWQSNFPRKFFFSKVLGEKLQMFWTSKMSPYLL